MIEILRPYPQSNWVLLLFLIIALISVFLYKSDPKRFWYFYGSLFSKQFQINYGRQLRLSHYFIVLLSLQSILITAFIVSRYLTFYTSFIGDSNLFGITLLGLILFILVKYLTLFLIAVLFKKEKEFNHFIVLSAQIANLFILPLSILSIFMYLYYGNSQQISSVLVVLLVLLLTFSKMSTFTYMRKMISMSGFYLILYLCIFEIVPFLWLLVGLND